MAQYLEELGTLKSIDLDEYLSDFRERRAVERLIQLIVDVAVDLNTHILVDEGYPAPSDAYTSFIEAGKHGVLPPDLARSLAPSTGERNIIVHEYETIDDAIVFLSISETLRLYGRYVETVLAYVDQRHRSSRERPT